MEIREATIKDREAIFKIWLSCFTDDQDYINSYLDYCFPYTTTLLLGNKTEGDVSVISILPSTILLYVVKNKFNCSKFKTFLLSLIVIIFLLYKLFSHSDNTKF